MDQEKVPEKSVMPKESSIQTAKYREKQCYFVPSKFPALSAEKKGSQPLEQEE